MDSRVLCCCGADKALCNAAWRRFTQMTEHSGTLVCQKFECQFRKFEFQFGYEVSLSRFEAGMGSQYCSKRY